MSSLVPTDAGSAFKLAEMMSTGKLVPTHLQRSPGDCLMVIEQAMRWGMSPFAVAQCTSVIQGKLMFEGKLVAAAIQSCGILADRLNYEFTGEGDKRAIKVSATIKGEAKPREIVLALKDAKTSNGMWTKQPDQQLVYAGTRVWGRRHAPEVMLGVYSPEEMEPAKDVFVGTTIEAETPKPEPITPPDPPKERTWPMILTDIRAKAADCVSMQDAIDLGDDLEVVNSLAQAGPKMQEAVRGILADTYARFVNAKGEEEMGAANEPEGVE
jgi:hypothetical protein